MGRERPSHRAALRENTSKGERVKRILLILSLAAALAIGVTVSAQAITKVAAKHQTNVYAKAQCQKDSKCKRYGAAYCHATRAGVGCYAYNFEYTSRFGKYTCRKYIEWTDFTHYRAHEWKCNIDGWNFQ
jgi:hypothetical protein